MAKLATPLTDTKIKNAKVPQGKKFLKLFDGDGLFLQITPNSKRWKLSYRLEGKESTVTLGKYPEVGLSKARDLRLHYRKKILEGINPHQERIESRKIEEVEEIKRNQTFKNMIMEYLDFKQEENSETHFKRMLIGINNDVLPFIGDRQIDSLETKDFIDIFKRMKERGVKESIKKLRSAISGFYKWLIVNGYTTYNLVRDIDLNALIGKIQTKNYATLTKKEEIRWLIRKIEAYDGHISTKYGLLFMLYTAVRPINIRLALWSEINFDKKEWTIPKENMKTNEDHIVPLSEGAIKVLEHMKFYQDVSPYIFPSAKNLNDPMSEGTMRMALRRQGITREKFSPHGFRSMFSTIAHESSNFSHDVIEKQLAHSVGNKVSQAYNRAQYLEERKNLMKWWSDFIYELKIEKD